MMNPGQPPFPGKHFDNIGMTAPPMTREIGFGGDAEMMMGM
jgi:hypothetical protein